MPRKMLWTEAVSTANDMYNYMIPAKRNESPYKIVWKKNPPRLGHLVEFGRIGYVTDRTKIKSKMSPRSFKAIMIGYAKEHLKIHTECLIQAQGK